MTMKGYISLKKHKVGTFEELLDVKILISFIYT